MVSGVPKWSSRLSPPQVRHAVHKSGIILSALVDGVVLVARAGNTSREMVSAAFRQIRRARANIIGLVLNQVQNDAQSGHSYYYSQYGYGRDSEED